MRFAALVLTVILLIAPVVPAQDAPPQTPFTQEEMQKLQALQGKLQEAFGFKEYAKGLDILREELPILEAALKRIEEGEVDLGEQTEMWKTALRTGAGRVPGMAPNYYNQACCLAQIGEKEPALDCLAKAMEFGYLDLDHMKMDTDLDPIRNEARYLELVAGVNYNEVVAFHVPEGVGEAPAPLVIFLHERGGNEEKSLEAWKALADGMKAILAVPRAPINGGSGHYAWQRYTEDESALTKIAFTLEQAASKHSVDPARVWLVGDKQGAKLASLFALMHPEKVKGVVPINGYWNKYYFEDFLDAAKAAGLKICMVHGKDDPGFSRAGDGMKQLAAKEIPAKLIEFDGGKELPENARSLIEQALAWFTE